MSELHNSHDRSGSGGLDLRQLLSGVFRSFSRPSRSNLPPIQASLLLVFALLLIMTVPLEETLLAGDHDSALALHQYPAEGPDVTSRGVTTQSSEEAAQAAFARAKAAYLSGNWEEAIKGFKETYNAWPSPSFLFNIGASYHMKGKSQRDINAYRNAITLYRQYLTESPRAADRPRVEKSIVILEHEIWTLTPDWIKYDLLVEQIRQELALRFKRPDDPGLFERRQRLKEIFGRVPQAYARLLYLRLGEKPTCGDLSEAFHYRLASPTIRELLGILEAMPQPLTQAVSPPGSDYTARLRWAFDAAQAAMRKEQFAEAIECFTVAYRAQPFPHFLYNIGASYEKKGSKESNITALVRAVDYYQRYLAANPNAQDRANVQSDIVRVSTDIERLEARKRK